MPVDRPGARVVCLHAAHVLLLRWRDPVDRREVWEPPGGGLERGESWLDAARRELREEAGLEAERLTGPLMVARDYRWAGRHVVTRDAIFMARWRARPVVTPEADPELVGFDWVPLERLGAVGPLEPPELPALISSLRSARPSPPSR